MSEDKRLHPELERNKNTISAKELLEDHNGKINEYLQNCIFRGCSVEATIHERRAILKSIFRRVEVADPSCPSGHRQLSVWELLDPRLGSYYLGLIVSSLLKDGLAHSTRRKYIQCLRDFCDFVMAKPYVPGTGLSLFYKYGAIVLPFTKYDFPIHAADRPRRNRHALSPKTRDDFFEFLRLDYLPNHSLPHIGARDYIAIVLQTEIGARTSELLGIRSEGESCDVDRAKNRVRLLGKAKAYSGKRLRWVPLSPLAIQVLNTFELVFKPMFPKSPAAEYLFLIGNGCRLTNVWYWRTFRKIVSLARESGVQVPADLRPHDLRRTFATNMLAREPLAYRRVLKYLGHSYPSSAAPYLIATDEDVEENQNDLIDIFVDPYVNNKGEKEDAD